MNRFFVCIIVFFSLFIYNHHVLAASTAQSLLIDAETPFVVALEKDYPPFLFVQDGVAQGISFDYLKIVAEKLGRTVQTTDPLQLDEMLRAVKIGEANILVDITKTEERDAYLEFSNSYIETPAVVIGRKNQISVWDGGRPNAQVTIAVGKAYGVVSFLRNRYPDAILVEVMSDSEVIKAVALGAADVGVLDVGSFSFLQKREPLTNIAILENSGFTYSLSFAVSEKNKELIPVLNRAISEITEDERFAVYSKWISSYVVEQPSLLSGITAEIGAGLLSVVLLILIWNLALHKKVRARTSELESMRQEVSDSLDLVKIEAAKLRDESEKKTEKLEKTKKAMLNILEDIQQDKKTLSLLAQKFKIATESAKIGVMEMDIITNRIYGDDITCDLYEVAGENFECTFEKWMSFLHSDDRKRVMDKMAVSMQQGVLFEDIFRIVLGSGEIRYIKGYAQVDFDKDHKPVKMIGVNYDVTHEKEVDLEKTEFVSLASHQLKTPIGSMSWNLEMLGSGDYGPLADTQKEVVTEMYIMSKRMNELVNSLLNVSRIELGVFIIEPEPTDFSKLCDEVLTELKPRIETKKHEVSKSYSGNIQSIPADPKLLRIIFQNYLSNAVKYTPEHGKIEVKIQTDESNVLISVWNNGDPIPEKDKKRIFGKMFRASNAQQQDPDGNGLGLYLVKKIIENGGGKAWFESSKEKGTTFYISIPLTGMVRKEGTKKLD